MSHTENATNNKDKISRIYYIRNAKIEAVTSALKLFYRAIHKAFLAIMTKRVSIKTSGISEMTFQLFNIFTTTQNALQLMHTWG